MKPPIDTLPLFPVINKKLISFLKTLPLADWQKQTVARQWVVKDVVAHLLDGNFRRISLHRDGWSATPDKVINSYTDLVDYLNTLNADWVKATRRLSPPILIELLEKTNETVYQLFLQFDPFAEAVYPVSWAGENVSYNWFDIAREYTERWLHQQQIRDTVGDNEMLAKDLYHPFLHTFMQAWPFTMKDIPAAEATILKTTITDTGEWYLKRENNTWKLTEAQEGNITTETIIDGPVAWKLFSKSIRKENITGGVAIKGERLLGEKILDMISVMA
jgi:hypothetical protein